MQLELADSFLDDDMELTTLPALDPITGEIYAINAAALALLSPDEQNEIFYQAPFIIQKIQEQTNGTMSAGLFSKIRDKVKGFVTKFKGAGAGAIIGSRLGPGGAIIGGILGSIIQRRRARRAAQMLPPEPPEVEQAAAQQEAAGMAPSDPKFGIDIDIEPDPKPFWATPSFILPVLGVVGLITIVAIRNRRK